MRTNYRGVTLVVAIVTGGVTAVLTAACHRDVECTVAASDLRTIGAALERFARDHDDELPVSLDQLCFAKDPSGIAYLATERVPMDPWKRPYRYFRSAQTRDYCVLSLGRDGVSGGTGDDADTLVVSP